MNITAGELGVVLSAGTVIGTLVWKLAILTIARQPDKDIKKEIEDETILRLEFAQVKKSVEELVGESKKLLAMLPAHDGRITRLESDVAGLRKERHLVRNVVSKMLLVLETDPKYKGMVDRTRDDLDKIDFEQEG